MLNYNPALNKMKIEIVSPVHIGSGNDATSMDYILYFERGEEWGSVIFIDTPKMVQEFVGRGIITIAELEKGDFKRIRSIFIEQLNENKKDREKFELFSYPIYYGSEFARIYSNSITDLRSEKQLLLNTLQKNVITQEAAIPGSSIKGSIRTAVLSHIANRDKDITKSKYTPNDYDSVKRMGKGRLFEEAVAGKIDKDPFKNLIVKDITVPVSNIGIVKAQEIKKNTSKEPTPKDFLEAFLPSQYFEERVFYNLDLILQDKLYFSTHNLTISSIDEIKAICADFYMQKFEFEYIRFYSDVSRRDFDCQDIDQLRSLLTEAKSQGKGILRVGHYSHAESITVDTFREIEGKFIASIGKKVFGTTRTLADGIMPFGWVIFE